MDANRKANPEPDGASGVERFLRHMEKQSSDERKAMDALVRASIDYENAYRRSLWSRLSTEEKEEHWDDAPSNQVRLNLWLAMDTRDRAMFWPRMSPDQRQFLFDGLHEDGRNEIRRVYEENHWAEDSDITLETGVSLSRMASTDAVETDNLLKIKALANDLDHWERLANKEKPEAKLAWLSALAFLVGSGMSFEVDWANPGLGFSTMVASLLWCGGAVGLVVFLMMRRAEAGWRKRQNSVIERIDRAGLVAYRGGDQWVIVERNE